MYSDQQHCNGPRADRRATVKKSYSEKVKLPECCRVKHENPCQNQYGKVSGKRKAHILGQAKPNHDHLNQDREREGYGKLVHCIELPLMHLDSKTTDGTVILAMKDLRKLTWAASSPSNGSRNLSYVRN